MPNNEYDLIVLGSGPAGGIVARRCAKAGLRVAVVERRGWGGVCPLRGCEPKKVLVDAATAAARGEDMHGHGVTGALVLDWPELMRFKRSFTEPASDAIRVSLEKDGAHTLAGDARFDGPDAVQVDGVGRLTAPKICIATGASPRKLDFPGEELIASSEQFLDLDNLPSSIVFIGGGFVSFEFATVAARAGAKAVILHRSERVLKPFDRGLSGELVEAMRASGVEVLTGHPVYEVRRDGSKVEVLAGKDGRRFTADLAVHGAGRSPNVAGLDLERGGVEASARGVKVNAFMQSVSNPAVFAAGDCAEPGFPLTPTAVVQAETVARNILNGPAVQADLRGSASVVFTHPPLARVGMLEEEAAAQGLDCRIYEGDASGWSEHKRLGVGRAGYRILVDGSSRRIVGAHYLGHHAEEVANIFGLAVRHHLTVDDLQAQPWAYPSFGYAVRYMFR
ncbi:MAG: glutathione reductase [Desulfovibrionales bacterium]|nr:glutathione reductase [Desulfovibrionales bacterium]